MSRLHAVFERLARLSSMMFLVSFLSGPFLMTLFYWQARQQVMEYDRAPACLSAPRKRESSRRWTAAEVLSVSCAYGRYGEPMPCSVLLQTHLGRRFVRLPPQLVLGPTLPQRLPLETFQGQAVGVVLAGEYVPDAGGPGQRMRDLRTLIGIACMLALVMGWALISSLRARRASMAT